MSYRMSPYLGINLRIVRLTRLREITGDVPELECIKPSLEENLDALITFRDQNPPRVKPNTETRSLIPAYETSTDEYIERVLDQYPTVKLMVAVLALRTAVEDLSTCRKQDSGSVVETHIYSRIAQGFIPIKKERAACPRIVDQIEEVLIEVLSLITKTKFKRVTGSIETSEEVTKLYIDILDTACATLTNTYQRLLIEQRRSGK